MSNNNSTIEETSSIIRSPQERKEVLRKMRTRAESLQEEISDNTIKHLETCMNQTDSINSETSIEEKILNQEEVLLDSEVVNISSKVLKQCSQSLPKHACSYNPAEFAQKLIQYVKQLSDIESETPDWSLLEPQVIKCFKRTPKCSTLLGTLAPLERKEVNKKKSVIREAQTQVKRPENVTAIDKEEEDLEATVKMNEFIARYCKTHRKPVDFFKLILHPWDFGKTIENMLKISFLVRDGRVKILKNDSGILVVQPCTKEMTIQVEAGKAQNIQNVMSLTMEDWKILKDTYKLEKPLIE